MTSSEREDERILPSLGRLKQGEILHGLTFVTLQKQDPGADGNYRLWGAPETPWHIVLTQDCDLEQDASAREGETYSDKRLWGILIAPGWDANDVEEGRHLTGTGFEDLHDGTRWVHRMGGTEANYLRTNRLERWHFVEAHQLTNDTALAFDFKLATTVHPDYVTAAIGNAPEMRVGTLGGLWANHLAHRYITFLGRVPLP